MNSRLKEFRKSLGLTQRDFSALIGMNLSSYTMYENGSRPMSDKTVAFICHNSKLKEEWLRTGEGEMMELSEDAAEFEEMYNRLDPQNKKLIDDLLKQLLRAQIQEEKEKRGK